MKKDTKQDLEIYRQKVQKQYAEKLKNLEKENKMLRSKCDELNCSLLEAEDAKRSLEDWNERLKQLIDIPDDELMVLRLKLSSNSMLDTIMHEMSSIMSPALISGIHHLL